MNKTMLIGNLVRDAEVRFAGETQITSFSIAVSRKFKKEGQPDVDFINCIAFGKTGEFISNYFTKGSRIGIVGRLQVSSWETEGKKHYKTEVVVEEAEFVERKTKDNPTQDSGFSQVDDSEEDLPF